MHHYYEDIFDNISVEPTWFDENAVPRFCQFSTAKLANIYACEAALVLIKCQACEREFKVAFTEMNLRHELWNDTGKIKNISDLIADGSLHYGDPPNVGCCIGVSMNSIPVRVIEYWYKPSVRGEGVDNGTITDFNATKFQRDPEFECMIPEES